MKKLTKIIALLLTLAMLACFAASCGGSDEQTTIGVVIWSTDDGLGADAKEAIDAAAKALGVNVLYRTGSYDAEAQTTDFENLIAAGVNGIMVTPIVDTSTDELLKICEEAEIPMQVMFRNIIDEEAREYCMASKYFAGYVVEDEEGAGAAMVDKLIEEGCKTFGLLNREAGNGVVDRRQAGVQARLDELKMTYYTAVTSSTATATDMTDASDQLVAAHSDIDALICSSGSNGAIDALITNLNGKKIKLTSFDTPADIASSFDAGNLVMLTTGAQIDPFYAFINLYNKLKGNPFSDKPTEINSNYIYLESVEDITTYDKYFSTFKTYSDEEIVNLTKLSLDDFLKEVEGYSMQTVVDKAS